MALSPRASRQPRGSAVLLAFHYPPMVGPASQRAAGFARHLPEAGWEPVVVTAKHGLYHRAPGHLPPPVRTLWTRSPEPTKLLRPLRRRQAEGFDDGLELVSPMAGGPTTSRVRRFVRDYVYVPDGQAMWIPFAVAAARRALRTTPAPAVLLSSSVPYSAHLAALAVSRSEQLPWVAEFRDPWSQLDDRIRPRSRARKWIDAALEGRVVATADAVVVTSELTREQMVEAYPELSERISVVRNGFDPPQRPSPDPPRRNEPLTFVHAGTVSPPEISVAPLLRGVARVAQDRPGDVRLRIIGPPEPWRTAATALGGLDWLEFVGLVEPERAQREIAAASAGIVLVPGEAHRHRVAAKLIDYLGARRPVLGIFSGAGEMAAVGREYGDLRLVEDYAEGSVASVIERLLEEHPRGLLERPAVGRKSVDELTRRAQASRLAAVLESVTET